MKLRVPLVLLASLALSCAGGVPASAGVANARSGRCTRIPSAVTPAKVPADVKAWASDGPVIGGGSIWGERDNLPPRVRPELDPVSGLYVTKFAWYLIPTRGHVPTITGSRVDGPGTFSSNAEPTGLPGTAGFVASTLMFSTAGCWQVTGANNGSKLTFRIRVG
jgi:hypothetical protein